MPCLWKSRILSLLHMKKKGAIHISKSHSALNTNHTHTQTKMFSTPYKNHSRLRSVGPAQSAPSHPCNSTACERWPLVPHRGISSSPSRLKCDNLTFLHHTAKPHTGFADCTVYHRIIFKYFYF